MLDITVATCSDRGQRDANEDALRAGRAGGTQYAVLADGAGGHERGAEASRRVVDRVEAALCAADVFTPERLNEALLSAHAELQREQMGAHGRQRMHATVVVLWIDCRTDCAVWSHVGDSRLYRLRYGAVDLVTADDSVVQSLLDGGLLTPQQAQDHPMKNQLLAAVGMQDGVEPHTLPAAVEIEDGDAFLLCTDGWWGMLSDTELTDTLTDADTPQAWLDAMRDIINARGASGQDNFSAIAVWVSDPSESTRSMVDTDTDTGTDIDIDIEATQAMPLAGSGS
jgi:PPM family protein phosphatase